MDAKQLDVDVIDGAFAGSRGVIVAIGVLTTACSGSTPPPASPPPPAAATCADLACLQANEGEIVDITGSLYAPKPKAIDHFKVVLTDDTRVVITRDDAAVRSALTPEGAGRRIVVRGRIFTGEIPERYGIIGRSSEPHLLDTSSVTYVDD